MRSHSQVLEFTADDYTTMCKLLHAKGHRLVDSNTAALLVLAARVDELTEWFDNSSPEAARR